MVQEYQPGGSSGPNRLLQRYFAARNVLAEVDFGALTETQVEPIYGIPIMRLRHSGRDSGLVQSLSEPQSSRIGLRIVQWR
jgi:hypothetical protein